MKPTLILVDDAEFVREQLRRELENDFEIVGECGDGVTAVELCWELSPDLVLMDVVLPKMSGIDATRILLEKMGARSPKVVMMSGLDDENLAFQAFEAGACDYLTKPTKPVVLKEVLWNILHHTKAA